jgi:translation initiation factor IF-3
LSRPFPSRFSSSPSSSVRINGKIRAREVRVVAGDGKQLGIHPLHEAINMAKAQGVDLVEVAPNATPPVCRLVDFGKFRYEQAKKDKEARKHHHANKLKEIQLSANIDPHDYGVKLDHGIEFLCEEMKVKISLRFRGREMMHKEFGFQVVQKFISDVAPYGHPDAPPKLIGKGITVMVSPLPRNKRAKNPKGQEGGEEPAGTQKAQKPERPPADEHRESVEIRRPLAASHPGQNDGGFSNNPFAKMDVQVGQ